MRRQSSGGMIDTSKKKRREERAILTQELKVVNIGISTFADDLRSQNVDVVHVDWKPPAGGDIEMLRILQKLGL